MLKLYCLITLLGSLINIYYISTAFFLSLVYLRSFSESITELFHLILFIIKQETPEKS